MSVRKSFLLRINPALYEALETWAKQELRSVNGQVEYLLQDAVRKRDRKFVVERETAQPDETPDRNERTK